MKKKIILFILSVSSFTSIAIAQYGSIKDSDNNSINQANNERIIEALDSLHDIIFSSRLWVYSPIDSAKLGNNYIDPMDVPDSIYYERIKQINAFSPIELIYNNKVKTYIQMYAGKRRYLTARMLGIAQFYFPLFEEYLDKYNLPIELKYLAIVESALNPKARSRAGAAGLWQFMPGTGKMYGLRYNSYIDERYDPLKSTVAACEHLSDLFEIYKDWSLVLAAYNSGAGNVNKAIRRAGGEMDFWKIMDFLPRETQGYVPAFIAVNYVMNFAHEHGIYADIPQLNYLSIDSVEIKQQITFAQISEFLKIPYDEVELLNPMYKKGIIPYDPQSKQKFYLFLQRNHIAQFIHNENAIYNYKSNQMLLRQEELSRLRQEAQHDSRNKSDAYVYTVESGDVLGEIADKYNCKVDDIMRWNNMYNTTIKPGQKLYVRKQIVKNNQKKNNSSGNTVVAAAPGDKKYIKYVYYTVQSGDTLWDIAKKYQGASVDEIKRLNNLSNNKLQPGQKLKIGITG